MTVMSFRAPTHAQRVLCIESRPDEIRSLLDALRTEKFVISMAFNAMQGYGRAVVQQPDIILIDVELGQIDGFAVCRLLKADPATVAIPVIFLTGNGRLKDRLTGLREGAVDYILKPFESEEVVARIYAHLRPRFMQTAHSEPTSRIRAANWLMRLIKVTNCCSLQQPGMCKPIWPVCHHWPNWLAESEPMKSGLPERSDGIKEYPFLNMSGGNESGWQGEFWRKHHGL
jgi:CheY-like chemotaxis protein